MTHYTRTLVGWGFTLCAAPALAQYTPPGCVAGETVFTDVDEDHPFCAWIQQLWRDGLIEGCAPGAPGAARFCPDGPLTRGQAAMLLERTLRDRLWAKGRPGTLMRGELVFDPGPIEKFCQGATGVLYGLSQHMASWGEAAQACPEGTWVCTFADLDVPPSAVCDTLRPDSACDFKTCDGTCGNFASTQHSGWVSNAASAQDLGASATESLAVTTSAPSCTNAPVWCCTSDG